MFFQNSSSINTINEFLERPIKLIEDIDADNELMFEFYKLLATVDFKEFENVPLNLLQNSLDKNKFINLTKESISELLEELLKSKNIETIKQYDYLEIMEKMKEEYQYKLESIATRKIIFSEEDLDKPELNTFIYLLTFVNILLKISDSVLICHEKNIKSIKNNNEILNSEYLNRCFFVLIYNMKLYFYEIMRIYYEQKQKFDYYICANISKMTILKQENRDLAEQVKAKNNEDNDKIIKTLYDELKMEKNKYDDLLRITKFKI